MFKFGVFEWNLQVNMHAWETCSGTNSYIFLKDCSYASWKLLETDISLAVLEDLTEENLLKAIRALAVREENPKVARVALSRMMQDKRRTDSLIRRPPLRPSRSLPLHQEVY